MGWFLPSSLSADDIFSATKYTKALEALTKLKKEKKEEIKVKTADLGTARAHRCEFYTLRYISALFDYSIKLQLVTYETYMCFCKLQLDSLRSFLYAARLWHKRTQKKRSRTILQIQMYVPSLVGIRRTASVALGLSTRRSGTRRWGRWRRPRSSRRGCSRKSGEIFAWSTLLYFPFFCFPICYSL